MRRPIDVRPSDPLGTPHLARYLDPEAYCEPPQVSIDRISVFRSFGLDVDHDRRSESHFGVGTDWRCFPRTTQMPCRCRFGCLHQSDVCSVDIGVEKPEPGGIRGELLLQVAHFSRQIVSFLCRRAPASDSVRKLNPRVDIGQRRCKRSPKFATAPGSILKNENEYTCERADRGNSDSGPVSHPASCFAGMFASAMPLSGSSPHLVVEEPLCTPRNERVSKRAPQ